MELFNTHNLCFNLFSVNKTIRIKLNLLIKVFVCRLQYTFNHYDSNFLRFIKTVFCVYMFFSFRV